MLNIDKAFHLCASECGLSIPHHFSNTVRSLTETENKRICRMSRLNSGSDRLRKIQVEVAQTR